MKIEVIGVIRVNIEKDRGWSQVELKSVEDKGNKILFSGTHLKGSFVGYSDMDGNLSELRPCLSALPRLRRGERIRQILENAGYRFEHPTLVLEGKDGWFTILTPGRTPQQAIVHWDGTQADFFSTIPEQLLIDP